MNKIFKNIQRLFALLALLILVQACVEPIELETETFEDMLAVQATITDELKLQEVSLSRTFRIEEDGPTPETGAEVIVLEDSQTQYAFQEFEPGKYRSLVPFQAHPNRTYQLRVITRESKVYTSNPTEMAQSGGIDNLYARRTTVKGEDGVALMADSYGNEGTSKYYRFEYEETYKIYSRYSSMYDLIVVDNKFVQVPKTKEETICYNTASSNNIIVTTTNSLAQNNLESFLVRFIDKKNPILSRRYSIFVKQYAISPEAFAYYSTLNKLAGSDNLFSQNQPGFVEGNINSEEDPDEKVLGFFNVSSVSSKRIFFNYTDFFTAEDTRPVFTEYCNPDNPSIAQAPLRESFISLLESGSVKYLGKTQDEGLAGGPYRVVEAVCVDCTLLGTNEKPEFWKDETDE